MRLGICSHPADASGLPPEAFDFLEVNVQTFLVPAKDEEEFLPHLEQAKRSIRPVRSANCFLPGDLKLFGPQTDRGRLTRYAETAFSRARQAGIGIIVFGSGGARGLPPEFPRRQAVEEFSSLLSLLGSMAQAHGVTLVVEPLNRGECNFINSLAEGAEIVERCNHPNVRLLADFFHMLKESEPASEIVRFGSLLRHTHAAELVGRAFPGKARQDFRPFFRALDAVGYTGDIALECTWDNIQTDLLPSAAYFRGQMVVGQDG